MITIVANYRTGSSTFHRSLGGNGTEYLHNNICEYRPPSPKYSVYKVMPDQFHFEKYYENFELDYLQKSDEIYYTLRENVSDQIKSYVYATKTGDWHPWQENMFPDNTTKDDVILRYCTDMILKCLQWQLKIYKKWGGTLVWLGNRNNEEKYSRRIEYWPDINDINFDVKSMFS